MSTPGGFKCQSSSTSSAASEATLQIHIVHFEVLTSVLKHSDGLSLAANERQSASSMRPPGPVRLAFASTVNVSLAGDYRLPAGLTRRGTANDHQVEMRERSRRATSSSLDLDLVFPTRKDRNGKA